MIVNIYNQLQVHATAIKQIVPTANSGQIASFLNLVQPQSYPVVMQFDNEQRQLFIANTDNYTNINQFSNYLNQHQQFKLIDSLNHTYDVTAIEHLLADSKTISFVDYQPNMNSTKLPLNLTAQLDREHDPHHIYEWVITPKTVVKQAQQLIEKYHLHYQQPLQTFILQTLLPYRQLALITSDYYRPTIFTSNIKQAYQTLNRLLTDDYVIEQWNLRQQFIPLADRQWLYNNLMTGITNESYQPLPIAWTNNDHPDVTIKLINSDYLRNHPHIHEQDIPAREIKTGHLSVITSPLGILTVDEHVLHHQQQQYRQHQQFKHILDDIDK